MAVVYKSRSLAKDVSRCKGSNCYQKNTCARHVQLIRDKDMDYNPWDWVPVGDFLRHTDECTLRIEEEK